jgi:hypothetical protein
VIAQPAGLGGIVRHYYYGQFFRGFHAKSVFSSHWLNSLAKQSKNFPKA